MMNNPDIDINPATILDTLHALSDVEQQYTFLRDIASHADQRVAEALSPLLQHSDGVIRLLAANVMQAADPQQSRPILLRQLLDEDPLVRVAAAQKLEPYQISDDIVNRFLPWLKQSEDKTKRMFAIRQIGRSGDSSAYDIIEDYLRSPDRDLRYTAIEGVIRLGGDRGITAVLPLLRDEDYLVRDQVCAVLSAFGNNSVTEALLDTLLQDSHPKVRMGAAHALGCVGDDRALEPLEWVAEHDHERTEDGYTPDVVAARAFYDIAERYGLPLDSDLQDD